MTVEKAIKELENYFTSDDEKPEEIMTAISALMRIGNLKDRPCEACEFHKENGCCKWNCVFDALIYAKYNEEGR